MMLSDLIALIKPVSPVLAAALSGPNAAAALSAVGRALLQDEDATVDQLTDALKSDDADAHLKIASAEADFRRATVSVQIQLAQLANQDAASARDALLQMETVAANDRANARQRQQVTNDRTNSYLAYIVTVGFLLTIILVSRPGAVNPNNGVLQTLLGILGTGWASIMAFYYGSSVGSREKTAIIGEANTPPKTTSVASPGGS